jgi:hypothetical protein
MPKARRDWIVARQETDALDALEGLKEVSDMPIKDLQQGIGARLKRAGSIRLGYKTKKTKYRADGTAYEVEYPVPADHFVLPPELIEVCGEKPNCLSIYFPFNELDRNFPAWHQAWTFGCLRCRGDGEQIDYATDPQTGEILVRGGVAQANGEHDGMKLEKGAAMRCPGLSGSLYPKCADCRPNALLIVLIRDLGRLAYYQIATTSKHNITTLTGQMLWYLENWGRLQGIPFVLELRPEAISTPSGKNGKRVRQAKFLLSLEPDPDWVKAMLAEMHQRALPGARQPQVAIPAQTGLPGLTTGPDWEGYNSVAGLDDEPEWEPVEPVDENGNGEPEPELEPPATPQRPLEDVPEPTPQGKPVRPLEPAAVKAAMQKKVQGDTGVSATVNQKGLVASKGNELFAGDQDADKKYHTLLQWLWGITTTTKLTERQASAMLDWMLLGGRDAAGDYPLHPAVSEEARCIVRQALLEEGQLDMFDSSTS